ncbi:Site-specific DNA recombinase [Rhizobiales bacterium GAS113]|nr:Site-specific DNA recombinase [Rhizobiales bacterium GAS113]
MTMSPKIADQHLSRPACIYIRQSTMGQVRFNQESTERQYNLMSKAESLGWKPEQIRILDRDLGQSGAATTNREDFKALVGEVAMGRVGAIFSLEASRLARSNQDWHRLLELCAITSTLVIDEDGCYNPAEFNDGLVLGMKGTFAQAELHIIRARLHGGKLNKASKGELRFPLPVGFVFEDDKIVLDPDQEVQGAVRTVFDLFARESTAFGVVQRFNELDLRFPRRAYGGAWDGKLLWGRLTHSRVLGILANPSYAGTYVFGRYQSSKEVASSGEIRTRSRLMPQDAWRIVIPDHHEGYISADQFIINRQRLTANRTNAEGLAGPVREGLCLLQGLLLCGVCGRRLGVRYTGNGGIYPIYQCVWKHREALASRACLTVSSTALDQAITERLVSAITPVTIELALAALSSLEERDRDIGAQWRMQIERARYDAGLAERRYEAVDPSNRLIAATLETRWNDALQRLHGLEAELAAFERKTMRAVTAEQKQQILRLAKDFPRLWAAATTTPRDRKRILRLPVRDITVVKGPEPKTVRLHIRWQGGEIETLCLQLPRNRAEAIRYPMAFVARIRELAADHHDDEIVTMLRDEGQKSTATGKLITLGTIKWLRYKYRIPAPPPPEGTLNVRQVRDNYGVSLWVVHYWIARGIVPAVNRKWNAPYAITIDKELDRRLREWVVNSAHLHPSSPTQAA